MSSASVFIDDISLKYLTIANLMKSVVGSTANVIADVNIVQLQGTHVGMVLNLDSATTPQNFVICYIRTQAGGGATTASVVLDKAVWDGSKIVYSNVITGNVAYVAEAQLRVVKDGTSYWVFYNNIAVGTVGTVSDATIIGNTLHGLFSTHPLNSLTRFMVRARGNENQYAILDNYLK